MVFVRPHWPRVTPEIFEDRSSNSVHGQTLLPGTLSLQITCTRSGLQRCTYGFCTQVQGTPLEKMINELTTEPWCTEGCIHRHCPCSLSIYKIYSTQHRDEQLMLFHSCKLEKRRTWSHCTPLRQRFHRRQTSSFVNVRTFAAQLEGESRRRRALSRTAMWGLESIDG